MFSHFKQLGKESLIYGLAGVASKLISIFLVPIYARLFSQSEFAVMSLVTICLNLAQIFMVLALDSASYRWFYDTEETQDQKVTIATWVWCEIATAFLLGFLLFFGADWLAQSAVRDAQAGVYFRLAGVSLPFSVLVMIIINWLRFQRRAGMTVIFTLFTSLVTILLNILLVVVFKQGVSGVYLAQIISNLLGTLLAAWIMRDWISPVFFRWSRLVEMLRYSAPLIPAAVASWIVTLSGRFFIERYGLKSDVAVYQIGATIAMIISMVITAFQQAWGPFSMSIHKRAEARQVYATTFLVYVWGAALASTIVTIFSNEIIRILATDAYLDASSVVGVLSFSYLFIGLLYIANIGPSIAKSMAPVGVALIFSAALNIFLNFLWVPQYGNVGAAVASLISQAIVPIYVFYRAQQIYPIPYRFGTATLMLLFSAGIIFLAEQIPTGQLWMSILIKALLIALYAPLLFVLRVITPGQLRQAWLFFSQKVNPAG